MPYSYNQDQAHQDLEQHYQANVFNAHDPLIRKHRAQPGSIFYPGHRIKMNIVAMFLCVWIPWADTCFLMMITGFKLMHDYPTLAWLLVLVFFCFWLYLVLTAVRQRRHNPDPTWYTFLALVVGVATFAGLYRGSLIYENYTEPYWEVKNMNVQLGVDLSGAGTGNVGFGGLHGMGNLDGGSYGIGLNGSFGVGTDYYRAPAAGQTKANIGESLMDVGVAQFAPGSEVGTKLSWRFKWKDLYCVAPVLPPGGGIPNGQSYDVWLVGKNCCAEGSNDFRCGDWSSSGSSVPITGIRVTDKEDLTYFHLAVQQAESIYRYQARFPVFYYSSRERLSGSAYETYGQGSGSYYSSASGATGTSSSGSASGSSSGTGSGSSSSGGSGTSASSSSSSGSASSSSGSGSGSGSYGDGTQQASDAGVANANRALENLRTRAREDFMFWAAFFFVMFVFLMALAAACFSYLGRLNGAGGTQFYNDASWQSGGNVNTPPSYT